MTRTYVYINTTYQLITEAILIQLFSSITVAMLLHTTHTHYLQHPHTTDKTQHQRPVTSDYDTCCNNKYTYY